MENYFSSQRDHIFRNVEVLIYIFDVESRETQVLLNRKSFHSKANWMSQNKKQNRKISSITDHAWTLCNKIQKKQKSSA